MSHPRLEVMIAFSLPFVFILNASGANSIITGFAAVWDGFRISLVKQCVVCRCEQRICSHSQMRCCRYFRSFVSEQRQKAAQRCLRRLQEQRAWSAASDRRVSEATEPFAWRAAPELESHPRHECLPQPVIFYSMQTIFSTREVL